MRQTCINPVRVELNHMCLPSGEYSGPSSRPAKFVSCVSGPPSTEMVQEMIKAKKTPEQMFKEMMEKYGKKP